MLGIYLLLSRDFYHLTFNICCRLSPSVCFISLSSFMSSDMSSHHCLSTVFVWIEITLNFNLFVLVFCIIKCFVDQFYVFSFVYFCCLVFMYSHVHHITVWEGEIRMQHQLSSIYSLSLLSSGSDTSPPPPPSWKKFHAFTTFNLYLVRYLVLLLTIRK